MGFNERVPPRSTSKSRRNRGRPWEHGRSTRSRAVSASVALPALEAVLLPCRCMASVLCWPEVCSCAYSAAYAVCACDGSVATVEREGVSASGSPLQVHSRHATIGITLHRHLRHAHSSQGLLYVYSTRAVPLPVHVVHAIAHVIAFGRLVLLYWYGHG
jgi:hypothetical protein